MFRVQIHKINNASIEEKKAFTAGALQLELELNDPDFWFEVALGYNEWENKPILSSVYTNGHTFNTYMSFKEFKDYVLSGVDKFNQNVDGDLDLLVTYYYSFRSVVGYTKPSTWWTWTNRNIISGFDVAQIAGHILHEYMHNLGLSHPNTNRDSVVYKIGYLVRDRIRERLNLPDTINIYYRRSLWTRIKRFFGGLF